MHDETDRWLHELTIEVIRDLITENQLSEPVERVLREIVEEDEVQ